MSGYKKIKLSQGKSALVDSKDYELIKNKKWFVQTGWNDTRYAASNFKIGVNKWKIITMHRFILKLKKGQFCDHINGNGLDNRRSNLRKATKSTNGMNRGVQKNTNSGLKGVYFFKHHKRNKPYYSRIEYKGKRKFLGYFKTPLEAHNAYKKAALKYHGEFAKW